MPLHKGAHIDLDVLQYFVAAPTPNETDGVCVDVPREKRHVPAYSEGSGVDVFRMKAQFLSHVDACDPECLSEIHSGDVLLLIPHSYGAQWGVEWFSVVTEVLHSG